MNPYPSTPAPRRFLLPGRSTQSSQTPGGPPRFHFTPRFGSSSVPRPTQRRELDIESEEEVISESSLSGDERGATGTKQQRGGSRRRHALDIESDASSDGGAIRPKPQSRFDIESESSSEASQGTEVGREAKRRRVSISSLDTTGDANADTTGDCSNDEAASGMSVGNSEESSIAMPNSTVLRQQPIFQQAPRFKPLDDANTYGGLPVAFSPQRRGARYVPGGMAAQLQGWLSEVKGWEEHSTAAERVVKMHVEQVRPGRRMYLIQGRVPSEEASQKWILAGEGKLTGLGKRAEVKMGSVVLIEQPTWDVELEGSTWNVACEWSVE